MFLLADVPLDPQLASRALLILGVLAGIALVVSAVVTAVVYWGSAEAMRRTVPKLVQKEFALRLSTVVLIVFISAVLALVGALNSGAVAILSGIAGYVLGGVKRPRSSGEPEEDASSEEAR